PIFGSITDQRGRKFGMLAGVFLFTLGMGMVALFPNFYTFSIAILLAIVGKYLFDPAMQAYFGDRIPYERRGLALAVTEAAWSLSFIVGVPLIGFLIAGYGWSAPFPYLAGLGLVMFTVIWMAIPRRDTFELTASDQNQGRSDSIKNIRSVLTHLPAIAGISIAIWASAGNEMITLIFGLWLEDSFGLKIAALAGASAVIGISELGGEGLVALTTDRLGKPRALVLGLTGNAVAALLLPIVGRTELGALIGLFLFYITFEYVMVSHIPLMTEVMPKNRATLLSFNVAGHSLGRMIGALLATFIYQRFGFLPVAFTAILFNVFALLALGELTEKFEILSPILARMRRIKGS
ncbi:MAG TPA: MFS transporter, partial [Anaerolineales bacterium]|nr:MFS transporter [Anaerolineales bacterium]